MEEKERKKYGFYLEPSTVEKMDDLYKKVGQKSRSQFVENALNFYCGYLISDKYKDYYPEIIVTIVEAALDTFEDRMASLMFKNAVELNMVLHILAASSVIDSETLTKLKGKCIDEVKRLHGNISFEEAYKYQKGK